MGKPGTSTGGPGQVMEARRTRREPGFSAAHTHGSGGHSREEADLRASGSVAPRFNYCGKPNCRRHGDPPTTARAVLPMDGEGKRQDGEPQAKRTRGRALRGVDRQRPTAASAHRRAASGGRRGDEPNPRDRGQGFILKLSLRVSVHTIEGAPAAEIGYGVRPIRPIDADRRGHLRRPALEVGLAR